MLVTSLMANAALDSVQHRACVREAGTDARKEKIEKEKASLKLMSEGASKKTKKRLDRIGECGIWISMMPHKLHGTLLTRDEFSDNTASDTASAPSPSARTATDAVRASASSTRSAARRAG